MRKGIIFFAIGGAFGLAISLGFLNFPTADDDANEFIVQPSPPWIQDECDVLAERLWGEEEIGIKCIGEVGFDEYDAKRQGWIDLIGEYDLTADEAFAGFFAWLANQGENCRKFANLFQAFDENCR